MPELPEVEVVRAGLALQIMGAHINSVEVYDRRSLRRHLAGSEDFSARLSEAKVLDIARRGKYLWILLGEEGGQIRDEALVVHLGMSGQILLKTADFPGEKHLKIIFNLILADGSKMQLRFIDQRIFGGMYLDQLVSVSDESGNLLPGASRSETGATLIPQTVEHIGRDPIDPYFSAVVFRKHMLASGSGIKRLLLNQSVVSGVGNIYADEALWLSRLHYAKPANQVSAGQSRELLAAVQSVMGAALEAGGTSFDSLYVNVNGESGYFDRSLKIYGRAGQPCIRCLEQGRSSLIVREPFMNRSSYRCPHCQRRPKGLRL